jgi:abnormal spindle-like microcephaly-associated protein
MRQVVLYRIMVLIFFLDQAKLQQVMEEEPLLFRKEASDKSTEHVLLSLCRHFMARKSNFIKHLGLLGLTVQYQQSPLSELEFRVNNLAVDLRDGVILTRVLEVVTRAPPQSLLKSLRLPAKSRWQMIYNSNFVLQKLREWKVPIAPEMKPNHIVDGHCYMLLHLLWPLAFFALRNVVPLDRLRQEIRRIRRTAAASPHIATDRLEGLRLKELIVAWCSAVMYHTCRELTVSNLSTDLADGRVVCYLLHFYHPNLLPAREIGNEVEAHSLLARQCLQEIGGIPHIMPGMNSTSIPDEKSMLLCLSYLCSRLMEGLSALLLQRVVRGFLARRHVRQERAARHIWQWAVRRHAAASQIQVRCHNLDPTVVLAYI